VHYNITFQEIILKLQNFWHKQGCLITQAEGVEVGAGTLNKNTFFKVLDVHPWAAAYVEPTRRPADGRYGESLSRLQHFYQFQVIYKPVINNMQDLYLHSLEYLNMNLRDFDIRFIHDDWEHPAIGAYGLGWEVWSNGLEISQYTYFQQCGGLSLDIVSCELTYGLERLAMCLQGIDNVYDILWGILPSGEKILYSDMFKKSEFEWSCYNFHESDVNILISNFRNYEKQSRYLIDKNLIFPAYDCILKCSHIFNLLEARKMISMVEHVEYINRIRILSNLCAIKYMQNA